MFYDAPLPFFIMDTELSLIVFDDVTDLGVEARI
jgi:hypothetical protein